MENNFTIKGKQLACTLEGDPRNPAVFLIHDLMSHRGVWRQTIQVLKDKYYCVAIDLLGFGASDKPADGDYSITAQGQRILIIADQLKIQNFSLIGHSMGGQIALYIAAVLAPQRVNKVMCIGGVITGTFAERVSRLNYRFIHFGRKWPWLYSFSRNLINFPSFAGIAFKPWFHAMDSIPFKDWQADRLVATNPASAISADESWLAIHAVDLTQHLRKIKAKTLLVSGNQDGTVPVDQAYLAQTLIPDNDLVLIEKCGHFPMWEKFGQFKKALGLLFEL
jgi:pimeloyl-ACP methyl ester carboxylesterase